MEHAHARGAVLPTDTLLRYRDGHALSSRRYHRLWKRIGQHLPWVAAQASPPTGSDTTLTWVERHFGYGVARAYAGHTDSTGAAATTTYIKADRGPVRLRRRATREADSSQARAAQQQGS